MRKIRNLVLMGLCSAILLVGCGTASTTSTSSTTQSSAQASQTNTVSSERVVATSVAVVNILDVLSVPVVGVPTTTYTLPDSAKDATDIGNPMSPDIEVIKSLNPTTVFSLESLRPTLEESFKSVNIPVEFLNLNNYDGLLTSIEQIGETTDTKEAATTLVKTLKEEVEEVEASVKDKTSPSVLVVFGAAGSFQVATEKSYVGDLVKRAGGTNIIENPTASFMPVDMEFLASKNPEYILLMTHANPEESKAAFEEEFSKNAAWNNFDAVKNDKVISLDPNYFGMSADLNVGVAMQELEGILYE